MNESDFWKIIDLATEKAPEPDKIIDFLVIELMRFSESELMDFEKILTEKLLQLDNQHLAHKIYGDEPISADDFLYVRCWAIIQRQSFYLNFLKLSENEVIKVNYKTCEGLLYAVKTAFEQKYPDKEYMPDAKMMLRRETFSNSAGWGKKTNFMEDLLTTY